MIDYINDIDGAPKAVGPYSQAVRAGQLVFISGQIPLDPSSGRLAGPEIEVQTEQVMKNLSAVLAGLGLDFSRVVKATIFMTDLAHFQTVNQIYARWLGGHRPARATIQVAGLPLGAALEVELVALAAD